MLVFDQRQIYWCNVRRYIKAFDTVSHSVLLSKLPSYGVMNTEFQWLTDYFFNKKQIAQYQGAFDNAIPVYTGVSQGPIIGPQTCAAYLLKSLQPKERIEHSYRK